MEIGCVRKPLDRALERFDLLLLEHHPSLHQLDRLVETPMVEEPAQCLDCRCQCEAGCEADHRYEHNGDSKNRRNERGDVDGGDLHGGVWEERSGFVSRHGVPTSPRKQH